MISTIKRLIRRLSWGYSGDKYYGRLARKYQQQRERKKWWHKEDAVVQDYLGKLPEGIVVLDVPFGTGRYVPLYLSRKMTVYGLDASPEMLEAARELLGQDYDKCKSVVVGDAANLPYENCSVDVVVCFRFLQSIIPLGLVRKVLKEIHRVMRVQAILEVKIRHEYAKDLPLPPENKAMRDALKLDALNQLMKEAGLKVVDVLPIEDRKTHQLAAFVCEKQ